MSSPAANSTRPFDVAVVGGGVAGLCAAIAAHDGGARVVLIEASPTLGGTASWSGGALWVPVNHHLREAGGNDDRAAALAYMRDCAAGGADEDTYTAYLDHADEVIRYLETRTPLTFEVGTMPDYQGGRPGGFYTPGLSRSLAPQVFNLHRLGAAVTLLRRSPYGTMPYGYQEFSRMDAVIHPERIDLADLQARIAAGDVGWGEALSAALLLGVVERDISIHVSTRLHDAQRSGAGWHLRADGEAGALALDVNALILCCGGYEWDPALRQDNFPDVPLQPATVPGNRGDAWRIAAQAGAQLGNRGHCWGWPGYIVPGETLAEGEPLVRTALAERGLPHLILVNARGERFVDESLPYHVILKALMARDAGGGFANLPAFHLFDGQFHAKYAFGPLLPGQPLPDWCISGDSPAELAARAGIDTTGLEATLARFNDDVRQRGRDTRFDRGSSPYGRFWGDPDNQPAPNLGTVEQAPYVAIPVVPSTIGTCGGPVIDRHGRVLDAAGVPLPGLYAAGNATAAISGPAYFGPGGTIGPAMVFGVLAGRHAAAARGEEAA